MQGEQRQMRRPVGTVGAEGPPDRTGDCLKPPAVLLEAAGIGVADVLDPADDQIVARLDILEADAAVERQFLLGRIDDLQQVPAKAGRGKPANRAIGRLEFAEEIADRVGIVDEGRLKFLGTLDELRQTLATREESLEELYLSFTAAEPEANGSNSHRQPDAPRAGRESSGTFSYGSPAPVCSLMR